MKLYVIGNGFDLAHKLPTKYSCFIKSNPEKFETKYDVFQGDDWNQIEKTIGEVILEKRAELEELISQIDADEITDDIISSYGMNDYGEVDYYGYEHEDLGILLYDLNKLTQLILSFEEDFKKYLEENLSYDFGKITSFANLLEEKSVFISFNYSMTLEKIYGIKDVKHIHGTLHDKIKIGYNSEISKFDMTLGDLEYPRFEDIIVRSKHDLPDRQSRYDNVPDENGYPTSEVVPVRERYDFHNEVSGDITKKKDEIQSELHTSDKSKFVDRITVMESIKDMQFNEVIVLGHSLGEMDYDFFDETFPRIAKIKCNYYDENDLKRKQEIAKEKKWNIEFINV